MYSKASRVYILEIWRCCWDNRRALRRELKYREKKNPLLELEKQKLPLSPHQYISPGQLWGGGGDQSMSFSLKVIYIYIGACFRRAKWMRRNVSLGEKVALNQWMKSAVESRRKRFLSLSLSFLSFFFFFYFLLILYTILFYFDFYSWKMVKCIASRVALIKRGKGAAAAGGASRSSCSHYSQSRQTFIILLE